MKLKVNHGIETYVFQYGLFQQNIHSRTFFIFNPINLSYFLLEKISYFYKFVTNK